ncbi:MAG: fatty acid CoA ligase family protein [Desulfobacterales bacterium]
MQISNPSTAAGTEADAPAERDDPSGPANQLNIAQHLENMAQRVPYQRAVVAPAPRDSAGRPAYQQLTFRQLAKESDQVAHGLTGLGITRGTRTVLMVPPSLDFFVLTFALFKVGAVPVVVDPGMGLGRMAACFRSTRPEAFIGIPLAHGVRKLYPKFFKDVHTWVTVGRRWFWGGTTLDELRQAPWRPFAPAPTKAYDMAAILFTTGSTGPAKGVVYTHGIFDAQITCIRDHFRIEPGEIDLPTFPLFALFDPALGMTAVIPDMDPTRPGRVNPHRIIEPIVNQGVTNMFASPALLLRVGAYGKAQGIKLPTLRRVVSAGAPVSPDTIEQFSALLTPEARIHTPYGASEAMPVTSISSREILEETRSLSAEGLGVCVGRPLPGLSVELIRVDDGPLPAWNDDLKVAQGQVGEIVVSGDLVTRHYFENSEAMALHKIRDQKRFRHRMGDLGWRDQQGRIWFCGRKSQRVITARGTLFTIPCESIFNTHPMVARSALVGLGQAPRQEPVICIERTAEGRVADPQRLTTELLELAARHKLTAGIQTVKFHDNFPVDIRHNAKIFREQLALWVAGGAKPATRGPLGIKALKAMFR